ncbi:DNA-3-methyladenine glycosylase [Microlunatus panaciterrae]|uniref:Putative 3-methyladenine DNA glycosylase n=1 Tax=Microlunatus panaciterrae TaxID=400768 RepID=A0ABS2RI54_9ACTN|nr:DNA-3-methyladenine glycosylase [Microlunatus panaciterrae]MBM7798669.1 DNA-3-methyladenine glycosylase [Microlunatus panaciterrae]
MAWDLSGRVDLVARSLLGATLRHGPVAVRLVEVEAYGGLADPASHAARGRTPRNLVMFGPPGHLYCYFSYGMHWNANVVCGPDGTASGVLLRAGRVVDGIEVARARRGSSTDRDLARGPGRLGQALAITGALKGTYLLDGGPLRLTPPEHPPDRIASGPRVGVALEADRPWRFWIDGDRHVSAYRRSPRAPALDAPIVR